MTEGQFKRGMNGSLAQQKHQSEDVRNKTKNAASNGNKKLAGPNRPST